MTHKPNITGCINRAIEALERTIEMQGLNVHMDHRRRNKQALADLKAFRDALPGTPIKPEHLFGDAAFAVYSAHCEAYKDKTAKLTAQAVSDGRDS